LQAAFVDINIRKSRSVYYWLGVMAGLFATILHRLTPGVIVELKRDVIEFRCLGRVELVEPVLWIVGEDRQRRIVAVGSRPVLTEPAKPVELFGAEWNGKSDREQSEFFEAFWRYNLLKVIGRKLFIRPTVLVRDRGFAPMSKKDDFHATIARTLEMAGAHEVQWDL
jgi:hypothetical protein